MKVKPSKKPGQVIVELDRKDSPMLAESGRSAAAPLEFKLKKILVPIDFSECSRKALQYAVPFAKQFGASLTLLHVVHINYAGAEYGPIDFPLLERQLQENGEKQIAALVKKHIGDQVPAETLVRTGRAASEIVEAARELDIDLIIISTHGYTGLKHVFLGSTTENVVRYAPCPVLTVREHEHEFVTP